MSVKIRTVRKKTARNKPYQIVVDQNMPATDTLFADLADIVRYDGRLINSDCLVNADALLCRSVTQVNKKLLQGSKVKFVGSATIGTEHLDIPWLQNQNIQWCNSAGCNAAAVAQYVLSAIAFWCRQHSKPLQELCIGVVGAGHVGSKLASYLQALDVDYCLCDPPLASTDDPRDFVSMQKIFACDVVTLHVPLTQKGYYKTQYLLAETELKKLTEEQLLINSSRGAVIDNRALSLYLSDAGSADVVLDVFENEPCISSKLAAQCLIATPHIAGHTLEGKLTGSWMVYQGFCESFGLPLTKKPMDLYPTPKLKLKPSVLNNDNLIDELLALYDIQQNAFSFNSLDRDQIAEQFDYLRKNAEQLANGKIRRDYPPLIKTRQ